MNRHLSTRRLSLAVAAAALALAPAHAVAQISCGNPDIGAVAGAMPTAGLTEAWVDPINGNDGTGVVNDRTLPFFTIAAAQSAISSSGGISAANRGLVHLDPGIYSPTTNFEPLPVTMSEFIDIQGVGAKQVIIRGGGENRRTIFFPWVEDDTCDCGTTNLSEILVDFSSLVDSSYDEMLDAVTLQGGDVQVFAETEIRDIDGRVSNCIFDMLDNPEEGYGAPFFGVLMVHLSLGEGEGYRDVRLNIFNNTFVQSWDPSGGAGEPQFSAANDSVAICDVNDPRCGTGAGDFNTTLRGVGNPSIQNNVIRAFDPTPPTALMGIDDTDVSCVFCSNVGATNAFDLGAVAGGNPTVSANGLTFCSNVTGALPLPVFIAGAPLNPNAQTGGFDPAFVGETLSSVSGGIIPATHARDWRILQDSVLVNQGSAPLTGLMLAANGTLHIDLACSPQSSFDFDGEYWGNQRIEIDPLAAVGSAARVDIGYDEASVMIECAMANDSIVHRVAATPQYGPFTGLGLRLFVYPQSAPGATDFHMIFGTQTVLSTLAGGFTGYSQFPPSVGGTPGGLTGPLTSTGSAPFDQLWLDLATSFFLNTVPLGALTPVPFVSAYDGSAHSLSLGIHFLPTTGFGANYLAEQGGYLPAAGPNAGLILSSNLQVSHE